MPEDGGDLNSKITLTFRQAVKGATVSLKANGKKFKTRVPAGVKDGQKIRLAGKGKPGKHGGKTGDMYLQVTVTEDPKFTMDGVDLVMDRGQFAVRGGILDVFPPTIDHPVSFEFFGDEIASIK